MCVDTRQIPMQLKLSLTAYVLRLREEPECCEVRKKIVANDRRKNQRKWQLAFI